MIGLDGIAVMNVVSNPEEAALSGKKKLQTRITHNDGEYRRWVEQGLELMSSILQVVAGSLFRLQVRMYWGDPTTVLVP